MATDCLQQVHAFESGALHPSICDSVQIEQPGQLSAFAIEGGQAKSDLLQYLRVGTESIVKAWCVDKIDLFLSIVEIAVDTNFVGTCLDY